MHRKNRHIVEGFFDKPMQQKPRPLFNEEQYKKDLLYRICRGGKLSKTDWDFVNKNMDGYLAIKDRNDLDNIVELMYEYYADTNAQLNFINLENVTDLSMLFAEQAYVPNISRWDTSNVTTIESIFIMCDYFNCDLSRWDVSKVTNMNHMFFGVRNSIRIYPHGIRRTWKLCI